MSPPPVRNTGGDFSPAVIAGSDAFFVAWIDGNSIYGALVSESGIVSPPQKLTTGSLISDIQAAFDGTRFLVIWAVASTNTDTLVSPPIYEVDAIRVAKDGIPIDPSPVVVARDVARASVASSGHEFVVATDLFLTPDVAIVPVDASGIALRVGKSGSIFHWVDYAGIASDLSWDGRDYVLAMRYELTSFYDRSFYGQAPKSWLAILRLDAAGISRSAAVTATAPSNLFLLRPAITANRGGDVEVVLSEARERPDVDRVRSYTERELEPMPPPPSAPTNVSATGTRSSALVTWTSPSTAIAGFAIESAARADATGSTIATFPPESRSAVVSPEAPFVRVRAITAAGLSPASAAVPVLAPRRRAAGH